MESQLARRNSRTKTSFAAYLNKIAPTSRANCVLWTVSRTNEVYTRQLKATVVTPALYNIGAPHATAQRRRQAPPQTEVAHAKKAGGFPNSKKQAQAAVAPPQHAAKHPMQERAPALAGCA